MLCAIWCHLYNLKNVKNTHGGVLLIKVTLLHGTFWRFLNYTNGNKSHQASRMKSLMQDVIVLLYYLQLEIFYCFLGFRKWDLNLVEDWNYLRRLSITFETKSHCCWQLYLYLSILPSRHIPFSNSMTVICVWISRIPYTFLANKDN